MKNRNGQRTQPEVSLVIPAYNAESTLKRCLDSIFSQDFEALEVILVNDGSTDRTLEIASDYLDRPGFVLLDQKNEGTARARWAGIKAARGEFVGFVDSDDELLPEFTRTLLETVKASGSDVAVCNFTRLDGHTAWDQRFYHDIVLDTETAIQKIIIDIDNGSLWNKLFRRELFSFDTVRRTFRIKYGEDLLLTAQLLQKAKRVAFVSRPLYRYYLRPDSASHAPSIKSVADSLLAYKKVCGLYTRSSLKNVVKTFPAYYFNCLMRKWYFLETLENTRPERVAKLKTAILKRCAKISFSDLLKGKPDLKTFSAYALIRIKLFTFYRRVKVRVNRLAKPPFNE